MLFMEQKSGKNYAMQGGLPGRRQQRSVLLSCHCIRALVGGVSLRESVVWRCSLNPRCTPTGPCHSLHVRVAAALSVCSRSICTQEHQTWMVIKEEHGKTTRPENKHLE